MNILQRGNFSSPAVQSKALSKQDENLPIRNINLKEYGTTQSIYTLASAWVRIYNLGAPALFFFFCTGLGEFQNKKF